MAITTTSDLGMQDFFTTTLSSAVTDGNQLTIYLNNVPTDPQGFLVIDYSDVTKREIIFYTAVGANYVTCPAGGRGINTTAGPHEAGADVRQNMTSGYFDALKDMTAIPDSKVLTRHIADGAVDGSKLSTNAITLGYAEVVASQTGITTETDLTNLAVTVTVPTGGRRIEITAKANAYTSVGADVYRLSIKEGSTVLSSATFRNPYANESGTLVAMASFIPTAGSHTYKLSLSRVAGTGSLTMEATSVNPAFILAKLI